MLWAFALLAPLSLLASDIASAWAWPLAPLAMLVGIRDALRHRRRPPLRLVVPAGRGAPSCEGQRIDRLRVRWRGPLAFIDWRDADGARHRLAFAPDILGQAARRELKLAMQRREAAAGGASMAG